MAVSNLALTLLVGVGVVVLASFAAARPAAYYEHEDVGEQVDSLPFKKCGTGAWDVFALELDPYPMVKVRRVHMRGTHTYGDAGSNTTLELHAWGMRRRGGMLVRV